MAIRHLKGRTFKEILSGPDELPIWKRAEYWKSPLAIFLVLGYIIYGISYVLIWALKWLLFSWIAPFFDWPFFCMLGLHKYRKQGRTYNATLYKCKICSKEMSISD